MKKILFSICSVSVVSGSLAAIIGGCTSTSAPPKPGEGMGSGGAETSCDGKGKVQISEELRGEERALALLDQWRRDHPGTDWVKEEKEKHAIPPPADNSALVSTGQSTGNPYGNYSARDVAAWARETEKFVSEGSRIFHDADLLGGTVGVSCDMCHPNAANTHPETYPKFQPQMGRVALLRDMINWCIENPVRGKVLAAEDPRMRALEAYITAQRTGTKLEYGKH